MPLLISQLCTNIHYLSPIIACPRSNNQIKSKAVSEPPGRRPKISPQLNRWSRARALRSGHKLDRPRTQTLEPNNHLPPPLPPPLSPPLDQNDAVSIDGGTEVIAGKNIYIVSDGTGWTAEDCVNAALGQFDYCLVDHGCPVNAHLFSGIDDMEKLLEIIKQAAKEGALLVYTLADPSMASYTKQACKLGVCPQLMCWDPSLRLLLLLGVSPSGLPCETSGMSLPLSDNYFRRIEAIEFTIKQDDGASPQNLAKVDIVLTGVSRTGKTPLSIYLAQKGYKVENMPIVMGVEKPRTLSQVDPKKVFGLTINPVILQNIRKARAKTLGLSEERSNYSEMDYVRAELEFAGKLFAKNPVWPVIDVTAKAIEETAALCVFLAGSEWQVGT